MADLTPAQKTQIEIDEAWQMFCDSASIDPSELDAIVCIAFKGGYVTGAANQLAPAAERVA